MFTNYGMFRFCRSARSRQLYSVFQRRTLLTSRVRETAGILQEKAKIHRNLVEYYPNRSHGVVRNLCIKVEDTYHTSSAAEVKENQEITTDSEGVENVNCDLGMISENTTSNEFEAVELTEKSKNSIVNENSSLTKDVLEMLNITSISDHPVISGMSNELKLNSGYVGDCSHSNDDGDHGVSAPSNNYKVEGAAIADNYPDVPLDSKFILPTNWRGMNQNKEGIKFPGEVFIIKMFEDEEKYKDILKEFAKKEALGFDSEHCSNQHLVCVIQLATEDKAILWQCYNYNRKLPPLLKSLLTGTVLKTGHACLQDARMISEQFNVHANNLVDTCYWAKDLRCFPGSLQAMCVIFLGKHLSKQHQQSNWKKGALSPGQIAYAATDAWVSLRVYQEMKRHGERLGVHLTPSYQSLQQYASEVRNNRKLKRQRYQKKLKEQKRLLKAIESSNTQQQANTDSNKDSLVKEKSTGTNKDAEEIMTQELFQKIKNKIIRRQDFSVDSQVKQDSSVDSGTESCSSRLCSVQGEHVFDESVNERELQIGDKMNKSKKPSSASRKRNRKFYAKFHVLE